MFCLKLFESKQKKGKYALQAYKKVPKKDLQFFNYSKNKLRYQLGYNLDNKSSLKLQQFINTRPQISQLYKQNLPPLIQKIQRTTNEDYLLRKILKSQYQQLKDEYEFRQNVKKFIDKDFPPDHNSMGRSFGEMKNVLWKRIPQLIKQARFICDMVSPEDVFQGELGNCYFLSAISALAENDFRIKNVFGQLQINPSRFYMARIMFRGVYQQVIVDDYVPVNQTNQPLFSKPTKRNEIWVMILQKCWAKLFGSYQNTVSNICGFPNEVLHAFSSAPTFQHRISPDKNKSKQLFDILFQQDVKGSVMCCGTISDQQIIKLGLVNDHAYALTGTFFMLWEDFLKYFKIIDICKIQDNANYFFIQDSFVKQKGKLFQLETKGGQVTVAFSQTNLRGNRHKKLYGKAIIILGRISQDNRTQMISYKYIASNSGKSYADFYLNVSNLQKGKYMIYAQAQWQGQSQDLGVVSVYTQSKVQFSQAKQRTNQLQFMYNVFTDHASKNTNSLQYLSRDPVQYICYDLLINSCGYGYIVIHLGSKSKRKLGLEFNQKQNSHYFRRQYTDKNLRLLAPYVNKGKFKITVQAGKTVIMLYKITDKLNSYPKQFTLPFPRIFSLTK